MDPRDFLRILRKSWPVVLMFVAAGFAIGLALTVTTSKTYEASVQVFVATSAGSDPTQLAQGNTFTQDRVQSYTSIATSPSVTSPVIQQLGLSLTNAQLANKITADAPQAKVLINIHVKDHDPRLAARLADAVAAQFDSVVQNTEQTNLSGKPAVKLTVIHPADVPSAPVSPKEIVNVGLGIVLGLLLGLVFIVLRDVLDNTVKGPQDFAELGVPVLGYVPFDKRTNQNVIAFRSDLHSARSEAYRQLRTNLQFVNVDQSPRVISITSAVPGEGKTTTAVNLAAALAEGGYRVCLVEADLRRPTLAKALGLVGDVGFTTVLIGKASLQAVLQNAGHNLAVLTSGAVPPNPTELLMSEQAHSIIRQIAERVDYVIIDSAPLLPVADGAEVAALSDATLVVHRAGKSTKEQATRSVEALAKIGTRPVGVVLNMITRGRGRYDDEYGYYYAAYRPDRSHGTPLTNTAAKAAPETPPADTASGHTSHATESTTQRSPSPSPRTSGFEFSQPVQYRVPSERDTPVD